jgi:glycosyltransferase involved in cell wall biosynthesis
MANDGRRTLLFLGRIHRKKGIGELLHAWAWLTRFHGDIARSWRLAIAGWDDGGHLGDVRALAAELGLGSQQLVFPGPLFGSDKAAALSHSDAFILPSHSEGLPMTVLEAWSHGLPVLMTRACNLAVGFEQGAAIEVTTKLEELGGTLARSLGDEDISAIGRRGRELVATRFTWPPIVRDLRELYDWLAARGPRPSFVRLD